MGDKGMQVRLQRVGLVTGVFLALVGGSLLSAAPASAATLPVVAWVAPVSGPAAGGTRVTITGARFKHVKWVKFGTVRGTGLKLVSAKKLRITAPAHLAGRVDIRVRTSAGTSKIRVADRFTYLPRVV